MSLNVHCQPCRTNFILPLKKYKMGIPCPNLDTKGINCQETLSNGHINHDGFTLEDFSVVLKEPEEKGEPAVVVNATSRALPTSTADQLDSYGNLHHTTKGGKNKGGTNHMRHNEQAKAQANREFLVSQKKKGNQNQTGHIGGGSANRLG